MEKVLFSKKYSCRFLKFARNMGEATEASAAGADTSGYDHKRLHSYPLIRVCIIV